jgi:hypothetical protein
LSADGYDIVSLTPHRMATFYLAPGNHELKLESGDVSPMVSFDAAAGGEYFFRLEYEHVCSATSLRDLSVSLSEQPNTGNADLTEIAIEPGKLTEILARSNQAIGESAPR